MGRKNGVWLKPPGKYFGLMVLLDVRIDDDPIMDHGNQHYYNMHPYSPDKLINGEWHLLLDGKGNKATNVVVSATIEEACEAAMNYKKLGYEWEKI